jgi:Flp pilus assembly protein TadG
VSRRLAQRAYIRDARGQATLEALALVPLLVAVGLGLLQVLAVGYAGVLAGSAAEAGALALARGDDPKSEARRALPGWSAARARIDIKGGRVRVHLRPPSPLHALARRLEVTGTAAVEAP